MNIEQPRSLLLLALIALAGCTPMDTGLGDSVKTSMEMQVANPDAAYTHPMEQATGATMAAAIERYRTDRVKVPQGIRTTNVGADGGGSSGMTSGSSK
jgi:hypothetical protein